MKLDISVQGSKVMELTLGGKSSELTYALMEGADEPYLESLLHQMRAHGVSLMDETRTDMKPESLEVGDKPELVGRGIKLEASGENWQHVANELGTSINNLTIERQPPGS